jgi:hypothetical protein
MTPKQLANVLIKILGLSLSIGSIPMLTIGLINTTQTGYGRQNLYNWLSPLSSSIAIAIGIFLIIKSPTVAAFLFKNENE